MQQHAYICRYGRQSLSDVIGRQPTYQEWQLFYQALQDTMNSEYAKPEASLDPENL